MFKALSLLHIEQLIKLEKALKNNALGLEKVRVKTF